MEHREILRTSTRSNLDSENSNIENYSRPYRYARMIFGWWKWENGKWDSEIDGEIYYKILFRYVISTNSSSVKTEIIDITPR